MPEPRMTREEVLAMKPGPELDAAVYAHVFGRESATAFVEDIHWDSRGRSYSTVRRCPYYSTEIAAAWQVVEKLRGSCDVDSTCRRCGCHNPGLWLCSFHTEERFEVVPDCATAQEAICIAALLLVACEGAPDA